MSQDTIDDLHAAEDLALAYQAAVTDALRGDGIGTRHIQGPHRRRLVALASDPYCRPTCGGHGKPCDDPDCGCPCH